MTHDPLCGWGFYLMRTASEILFGARSCPQCDLIACVRADERGRALDAARAALAAVYDEHERTCEQQGCEGPDREYALAVIDALLAKPDSQRVSEDPDD